MLFSSTAMLIALVTVMVASLAVARLAQERQERDMIRLYRLAALERRREGTRTLIRVLQEMDDDADLMRVLYQSLERDLARIQELDPGRSDLEGDMRKVQSGLSTFKEGARSHPQSELDDERRALRDRNTAFDSEREARTVRSCIADAQRLVRRMHQQQRLPVERMDSILRHLRVLEGLVAVNSQLHMGDIARLHGDGIKALGCYRRAEIALQCSALVGPERHVRMGVIEERKQQLLDNSNERGLLLIASGE